MSDEDLLFDFQKKALYWSLSKIEIEPVTVVISKKTEDEIIKALEQKDNFIQRLQRTIRGVVEDD